ncbi:choice-of-anchor A family protein [Salinimonas chungwhensis]|uniref:choice-of-anchor A family protein n=1 Tax=Salinimonas chungwhensis TaxID=265425 RepID=UPI0003816B1E|nr:choice-of-anchor A family protein [Salinimonas chungwhensis]
MNAFKQGIVSAALALASFTASASPFYLGEAADFNAYILEDMQGYSSDVEGRLAVGGNLTLKDYGLGLQLSDNSSKPVLVGGGDVTMRNARIYNGAATAAGNIDIDESVGLYNEPGTPGTQQFYQSNAFDFAAASAEVVYKSSLWGAYNTTADVMVGANGDDVYGLSFSGTNDINIFSIDARTLSDPNKRIMIDVPETSYTIINVTGEMVELFNTGFHLSNGNKFPDNDSNGPASERHSGLYNESVLFNFVDATSLVMHGIGFKGSILAPLADMTFYNGHIDGNLIVKSLRSDANQQTGQINNYSFLGFSEINEPATAVILMAGGVLLLRRKKKTAI